MMTTPTLRHLLVLLVVAATACDGAAPAKDDTGTPTPTTRHDVRLSAEQIRTAGIVLGEVTERPLSVPLEASAQIEPMPDRVARIGSRVAGRIVRVTAGVGDHVNAGATVAVVDSPDLARAKADYLSTVATARLTRETAEREKALFERRISSEREWRVAEAEAIRAASERQAAENRLHSLGVADSELASLQNEGHYTSTVNLSTPLSGTVVERVASLGQAVEPADILFTIMDLREVWVVLDVFEKDLRRVSSGQSAEVRVSAYPEQTFKGRVANVGVVLEPGTRAAKVRVVLPNRDGLLKTGMFATVQLQTSSRDAAAGLFVPAGAVQRDGVDSVVFVARDSGVFEARRIVSGITSREWIQVIRGLAKGERIAVTGAFTLKSELRKGTLGEGDEH